MLVLKNVIIFVYIKHMFRNWSVNNCPVQETPSSTLLRKQLPVFDDVREMNPLKDAAVSGSLLLIYSLTGE